MELIVSNPTILNNIASYLPPLDLLSCLCVSKTWTQAFLPSRWSYLVFIPQDRQKYEADLTVLHRNKQFIQHLSFECRRGATLRFDGLETLLQGCDALKIITLNSVQESMVLDSMVGQSQESARSLQEFTDLVAGIIRAHAESLEELRVLYCDPGIGAGFWDAMATCRNLKLLVMLGGVTPKEDAFWIVCSRVEILIMSPEDNSFLKAPAAQLEKGYRSNVKDFRVWSSMETSFVDECTTIQWLEQCRDLRRLHWQPGTITHEMVRACCTSIMNHTWPHLESAHLLFRNMTEADLICALRGVYRLKELQILTGLGIDSFPALAAHFEWIQVLKLSSATDIPSEIIQALFENCPNLTYIEGHRLNTKVVLAGGPWICHNLSTIHIEFLMDSDEDPPNKPLDDSQVQQHRQLIQRLAKLVKLKDLGLRGDRPSRGLLLTFETGLKLLSTLKRVSYIYFPHNQQARTPELEWMIDHWPLLDTVFIKLLTQEQGDLLESRGIFYHPKIRPTELSEE